MYITVDLPEAVVGRAAEAAAAEQRTFSEFVLNLINESFTDDEDGSSTAEPERIDELAQLAVAAAREIPQGAEFLLAELRHHNRYAWMSLSTGDRKQLGKRFRKAVEDAGVATWVRRRSDNHAVYRRS